MHAFEYLGVVALPALQIGEDAQWLAGSLGLCGVARESLVGHVRVVLERAHRFNDVDLVAFPAAGQGGGQLGPQAAVSTSAVK